MSRSLQIPYSPSAVPRNPDELPRFLEAEFRRIQTALLAEPVALSVQEEDAIAVTTAINWTDLFTGATPVWEIPGGSFDTTDGNWTCPQTGLYQVSLTLEVAPFGGGNKTYYAGVAIDWTGESSGRRESTTGGDDEIPLGVSLVGMVFLYQGTELSFEFTIVHDQFSGVADYKAAAQILRVSN